MLRNLEPEAHELAQYMSDLSEDAWYAGWTDGLEFALWDAVINGPREYGRLAIMNEHIEQLRQLANAAGGWIVFDDDEEETFIPMEEWSNRFETWRRGKTR